MATYRLAVLIKKEPSSSPPADAGIVDEEIVVVRQAPPPPLEEEYSRYVNSDLWDLPSAPLRPLEGAAAAGDLVVEGADCCSDKLDLRRFDLRCAIDQDVSSQYLHFANEEQNSKTLPHDKFAYSDDCHCK